MTGFDGKERSFVRKEEGSLGKMQSFEGKYQDFAEKYRISIGKYQGFIEKALFPLVLFVYPLIKINQGLDVADTTYSLTNFQYFGQMEGTWMVATFLANAVGSLLMHLPFGEMLIGMNFYTALVQPAAALMVYLGLRKRIPAPLLFVGEMLALGLCWCPSTILYNYLTYLLMTAGILFLYRGILETGKAEKKSSGQDLVPSADRGINGYRGGETKYFVAAGICLGVNVAVRMPNVVQAAFILAVWYGIIILAGDGSKSCVYGLDDGSERGCVPVAHVERRPKRSVGRIRSMGRFKVDAPPSAPGGKRAVPWKRLVQTTLWCLLGYVLGFGVPLTAICIRYGASAYPDMVRTMFAMTEQAADYKPSSMLTGMFGDYIRGLYWLVFAAVCIGAAGLAFLARQRLYGDGQEGGGKPGQSQEDVQRRQRIYKITGVIIKAGYVALLLVLLRFYWGRGMFSFRYYEPYSSIYYPAVLFLLFAVITAALCLLGEKVRAEQKILAALVLLEILLTPLGSNNALYPIINNLFVAVPFVLWAVPDVVPKHFLWRAPYMLLMVFVMVQSIGFHGQFVFQDGIWGEPRDTRVEMPRKAAGVYTNRENEALIKELASFIEEEGLTGRETITYGELPGLPYLLDMPPALSTAWPDLDSYRMTEYRRDLAALKERLAAGEKPPVIILSAPVAAYLSDDGEAIVWFGVDMEAMEADEKLRLLAEMIKAHSYKEVFGNARYVVYVALR